MVMHELERFIQSAAENMASLTESIVSLCQLVLIFQMSLRLAFVENPRGSGRAARQREARNITQVPDAQ